MNDRKNLSGLEARLATDLAIDLRSNARHSMDLLNQATESLFNIAVNNSVGSVV